MRARVRSVPRSLAPALALALLGCGGDEEAAPAAKPAGGAQPAAAKPAAAGKAGKGAAKGAVAKYQRIEDIVPADERDTIRHAFQDRDFVPDLTGNDNRDPFRSFVVTPVGLDDPLKQDRPLEPTEICTPKQQKASNAGLRDLRLVGIIAAGLRRWALFQDAGNVGHVVSRGDCLGKEKARIKSIDAELVTLEIVPEPIPNQPPRPIEERSIPLYPDALPITGDEEPTSDTPSGPPPVLPGADPVEPPP